MRGLLRLLPILLGSWYAIGMGIYVTATRQPGISVTQDPVSYIVTGLALATVLMSFGMQERRIQDLERRLQKLDGNAEPKS